MPNSLLEQIHLFSSTGTTCLVNRDRPPCTKHFFNDIDGPDNARFYGGFVYISTVTKLASQIEKFTPMIDPDPRMECFPMADDHIVVRYAGIKDATNVKIKLDSTQL